jgi:hypothetical protein
VGLGEAGPDRERAVVAPERFVKAIKSLKRICAAVMDLGEVRADGERAVIVRERLLEAV